MAGALTTVFEVGFWLELATRCSLVDALRKQRGLLLLAALLDVELLQSIAVIITLL